MILLFVIYLVVFFLFMLLLIKKRKIYSKFPKLKLKRDGIFFYSKKTHAINISNCEVEFLKGKILLIHKTKLIQIKNVKPKYIQNNMLLFKALGDVKIQFDCEKFYRYFNIEIISNDFEIETIKQQAICGLIANDFNVSCFEMKHFLLTMIEKLKITIDENQIRVTKNRFNFSYVLKYKVGHILKVVRLS